MKIKKFILEDVRCFAGRQELNIRPLTLLVGENSTGKSTTLGCFDAFYCFIGEKRPRALHLDFNVAPYQMGVFADIVRKSNPKNQSFSLGFAIEDDDGDQIEYLAALKEKEQGAEPVIEMQKIISPEGTVIFRHRQLKKDRLIHVAKSSKKNGHKEFHVDVALPWNFNVFRILSIMNREVLSEFKKEKNLSSNTEMFFQFCEKLHGKYPFLRKFPFSASPPLINTMDLDSFEPIRAKPQRTYDPTTETVSPDGSDIPMVLANMYRARQSEWNDLQKKLVAFGKDSGLFTDIHIKKLGKKMGDPFQLQIKVKGPTVNLIDVGYGVSQILPILGRILNASFPCTFLMQQPEVHLHPKGQAALSSLLIELVKQQEHRFIIETHSDYIIDRARIEIMQEAIAPEDVSLIYLEPSGNKVKVHNITFDAQANLIGVPEGYRDFFNRESDKLLGFN